MIDQNQVPKTLSPDNEIQYLQAEYDALTEPQRTWQFEFRGNGSEYFKIWLTNLALTIVTLTLYSPWAKVRRMRYFYGNTYLQRRKFDYTGIPTRILVGRLIALALYGFFAASGNFSSVLQAVLVLAFIMCIPWLIRSTMRFQARNSKYHNSRFYFSAGMGRTYAVLLGCVLVTVLTLGLLYPLALYWYKRYQLNHLYIGQLKFQLNVDFGEIFAAILLPMIFFIGLIMVAVAVMMAFILGGNASGFDGLKLIGMFIAGLCYIIGLFYVRPLIHGYLFRAIWSHVQIGHSILQTRCNPWRFAWIQLVNLVAMMLSLGLLYPWAQIRMYRYKIESMQLVFNDNPQQLLNMAQTDPHAIGEEMADIFDIDVSL